MKSNQYTKSEIESRGLLLIHGTEINDSLLMPGDNWGEKYLATLEQWKSDIPESIDDAKSTGYWDWFQSDDNYDSWDKYREHLIGQLKDIDILPDD